MTITGPGRTLHLTDLDGTLLDADGALSPSSRAILDGLLADGLALSVATARSAATARRGLGDLALEQPMVVYGGATAVDPVSGEHLWWEHFDSRVISPLIGASMAAGVTPLVFHLDGAGRDRISWVRGAETAGVDAFLEARPGDERMHPVDGWDEVDHERAFFVSLSGEQPVLRRLARMIRAISWGTGCALALQPAGDGLAVLDVTAAGATKGSAARRIAELGGFTRIVAFGDGANDLPLFAEADESYAVAGATEEVKAAATGIVPAGPDAVARFLAERMAVAAEV